MSEIKTPAICGQAICGQTVCGRVAQLKTIRINAAPKKSIYYVNDRFDPAGMEIIAEMTDDTTSVINVNDCTFNPTYLELINNEIEVSYTLNGTTCTAKQKVYVMRKGSSDNALAIDFTRSGNWLIDTYTKNIKFIHTDVSSNLKQLPFSLMHVYNAKNANNNFAACGYGWQTNFHQRIVEPTSEDEDNASYIYIDGNGERNSIIESTDGNGNTIYVLKENRTTKYNHSLKTLTDKNGNTLCFDDKSWLIEQKTYDGYSIKIVTQNGQISKIYEGDIVVPNKIISFNYENGLLKSLSFSTKDVSCYNDLYFSYDNKNLIKINYETQNGEFTEFVYDEARLLKSVKDPTGHYISYITAGNSAALLETPGSVIKHSEVTQNVVGFTPYAEIWDLKYSENTFISKNGKTTVLCFDNKQKCICSFIDENGGKNVNRLSVTGNIELAQTIEVEDANNSNILTNIKRRNSTVKAVVDMTSPTILSNFAYDEDIKKLNSISTSAEQCVNGFSSTQVGAYVAHFSFNRLFCTGNVIAKKGYIVSCFVKNNPKSYDSEMSAILYDAQGNEIDHGTWLFNPDNHEWQAGVVCLDNPDLTGVKIKIMIASSNRNDSWLPMYVSNLKVTEGTFTKMVSVSDNPLTSSFYETQKIVYGNGERSEVRYNIINNKVKLNLQKQTYIDEYNNAFTTDYHYNESNGKLLKQTLNNSLAVNYIYGGYKGGLSEQRLVNGSLSVASWSTDTIDKGKLINTDSDNNIEEYNLYSGKIENFKDAEQNKTIFKYRSDGTLYKLNLEKGITVAPLDTTTGYGHIYEYNKYLLTKVSAYNNTLHYIYDGFGQVIQVNLNGKYLVKRTYKNICNYKTTTDINMYNYQQEAVPYGTDSSYTTKVIFNEDGNPLYKQEKAADNNFTNIVIANYATEDGNGYKKGELKSLSDNATGTSLTHTFGYDSSTRQLKSITYSGAKTGSITIETSAAGKIKSKLIKFADEVKYNYDYVKNDNNTELNEIIQLKFGDNTATINKDGLGRIEGRYIKTGEEVRLSDTYDYTTDNKTINYVNHKSGRSESYNYDARKFISRYTDINGNAHSYRYDSAGRLVRENNESMGFTKIYTYNGGNISTVSQYSYTTEERPVSGITRTYSYTNDRLKSITEYSEYSTITYDSAGNPLQWRGNVLQWNGRKNLLSMKNNDNSVNIECTYDSSGIRQSKKSSGKTTTYYTEGSIIHKETRSDGTKLWYFYDQTGIAAIEYNGKMYYLEKNIQGDIVAILDSNQNVAAKYVYDAWGSHKVYNGNGQQIYDSLSGSISEAGSIGNVNPFRYRGYYYDSDMQLYYLQTRYYDQKIGRFINADSVDYIDPETINGLNLYAYCNNNPVMSVDPTGRDWYNPFTWDNKTKLIVGGTLICLGLIATVATGGAFLPALLATTKAVAISTAISAGIGFIAGGVETESWEGALNGLINGAVDGFMWGGIFAGSAQLASSGFKLAANLGVTTGRKGGIELFKNLKILSPNNAKFYENGGTIFKIGKSFRLDVGSNTLLHFHTMLIEHFPIGTVLATIFGTSNYLW